MIKRFPSRNNRSKGIKVKHVVQIILLLGVCFWLIYQVKHNHDKKKEFVENDATLSVRTQTDQIVKLGRKHLHPGKDEVNQNEKHEEEKGDEHIVEDEGNKHEHDEQEEEGNKNETEESEDDKHERSEQEEEENKHGAEEQEEDENKSEMMEDEVGEGGDSEIDENDLVKSEEDMNRDDEFIDEEEEKKEEGDEKENEDSGDEEKGGLVDNLDNHEAREEHYKGDDASSAVAHDTHATGTATETLSLGNSNLNLEMNITKPENETTYSDESNRIENDSNLNVIKGDVKDGISSNSTAGKEAEISGNDSLSNLVDNSYTNKTAETNSGSHLEASNNLTVAITESSGNMTGADADSSSSSEQNKTMILSESDHPQNTTVNTTITGDMKNVQTEGLEQNSNGISEENLPDANSTASMKTENGDAAVEESSNLGVSELEKTRFVSSNETENASRNLGRNESSGDSESDKSKGSSEMGETNGAQNIDATEDEMFKGDTQADETSDSSSANEIVDSVEHDAIDSDDTHIHEEVEVRTNLDSLADVRNGDNDDETAAE